MKRPALALVLSTLACTTACTSSSTPSESASADIVTSARGVSDVSYSDLGTSITVRGTASFFEGKSDLLLTNESDPLLNVPQNLVGGSLGIAATSVRGDNGMGAFLAEFDVSITSNGQLVDSKVKNRQCIGVYERNAKETPVNVGAFSSCQQPLSGSNPDCRLTFYSDAAACLAEQVRLVSVRYSDLGNLVTVKGQASFFEGVAHLFLRNETTKAANQPVSGFNGDEYESIANARIGGSNGVQPFEIDLNTGNPGAATVPAEGDCIGVYQDRGGREGVRSLGAFKFRPDHLNSATPATQAYFYDAAECLSQ